MNSGIAPLATVEDLSDIEEYTEGEDNSSATELNSTLSCKQIKPRVRSISEGKFP